MLNKYIFIIFLSFGFVFFSSKGAFCDDAGGYITKIDISGDNIENPIYFFRDQSLPVVRVSFLFKNIGSSYDSLDKLGLANLASMIFSETKLSESEDELKKHIIETDASVAGEFFSVNLTFLSKDFDVAMKLISKRFNKVNFSNQEFELIRNDDISFIKYLNQSPDYLAKRNLYKMIYKSHVKANSFSGNVKTVLSIKRPEIDDFFVTAFDSKNMHVSVIGDIKENVLVKAMSKLISKMRAGVNKNKPIKKYEFLNVGENDYEQLDVPQSVLFFGKASLSYGNKDYYILDLMNVALGGMQLDSILMNELRRKRALVYGASSSLISSDSDNALLVGVARASDESVNEVVNVIKDILLSLRSNGFSYSRFVNAKKSLLQERELMFSSAMNILISMRELQIFNLELDYHDRYIEKIERISLRKLNAFTKKFIDPTKFFFSEVGKNNHISSSKKK